MAKQVQLVAVKVLNCAGSGSTLGVVSGINWVRQNAIRPAVANMSLGGGISTSIDNAVTNAVNAGIVFAVAAGNSNANACNYSPARAAAAITVGATTSTDARATYSNYGSCVDINAPGSSITSAWRTSNTATNTISGTSMATPHVAGVAALYLSFNTTASAASVASALIANSTPEQDHGTPGWHGQPPAVHELLIVHPKHGAAARRRAAAFFFTSSVVGPNRFHHTIDLPVRHLGEHRETEYLEGSRSRFHARLPACWIMPRYAGCRWIGIGWWTRVSTPAALSRSRRRSRFW